MLPALDGELAVSAATLAELHFGVLVARDADTRAERLRRLSTLQRTFDALPLDGAVAASYGQLAATAHAHSARLNARNAGDFLGADSLVEVIPV